jgi:hypothetical protein
MIKNQNLENTNFQTFNNNYMNQSENDLINIGNSQNLKNSNKKIPGKIYSRKNN